MLIILGSMVTTIRIAYALGSLKEYENLHFDVD